MRKLIGVARLKKAKKQPTTAAPRRHRADDDMNAYLSPPPRTPNGAADLLSGRDNNPPPSSPALVDYDDDYGMATPEGDGNDSDGFDGDIYAQLNSFEEKLENELMDLENLGVNAGAAPRDQTAMTKTKGQDPDGRGERGSTRAMPTIISVTATASPTTESAASASLLKKGHGESGKNLAMLSGKTSKIMTDYQAYLAEIQNEFPLSDDDDDDDDEEMMNSPALVSIKQVRDDIRYSYEDQQFSVAEEGGDKWSAPPSPTVAERDNNYATGGGQPLYRAWSQERNAWYDIASVVGVQVRCPMRKAGDGMRYAHTWVRSRRAKRWIGMIVLAVAVVIVVSVATSSSKKSESLPNLEAEYIAEMEKEEEVYIAEVEKEEEQYIAEVEKQEEENIAEVEREEENIAEVEKEEDKNIAELEKQDEENIAETEKEEEENIAELEKQEEENIAELEKQEEENIAETEKEEEEKQDDINILVPNILNPLTPSSPNQAGNEPSDGDLYYNAAMRYQPVMYDRSKGWMGQTYIEALVFCEEAAGLAVCPYDAVCPGGIDSEPLGGFRDSPSGDWAWIPIVDDHNEWVQAGGREKCIKFSDMHGEKPEWGMTGEGSRDSTENVMCCMNVM